MLLRMVGTQVREIGLVVRWVNASEGKFHLAQHTFRLQREEDEKYVPSTC
jgi:hypothetical protein